MQQDVFQFPIEYNNETKMVEVRARDTDPVDYEIWVDNRHWFTINASNEMADPVKWKLKGDNYTGIDGSLVERIGNEIERREL